MQFSATLTKAVAHLQSIQSGMRLLLNLPKVKAGYSTGWDLDFADIFTRLDNLLLLCARISCFFAG